jgi:hypothetical protein
MATLDQDEATCADALSTLQSLGHSDDAEPALTAAESRSSYVSISDNDELSDSGKLQTCARQYINVMSNLAAQLSSAASAASRQYAADTATVFGVAGLPGDPATLAISRRDATERVEQVNDSVDLQRLLSSAVTHGDDVLSHAIAEAAVTNRDAATAAAFQNAYPALADAYERIWDITTPTNSSPWGNQQLQRLWALKPAPMQRRMGYEIEQLAAGKTSAGNWNV